MSVWIFQANPKHFRIIEALRDLDQMNWLVSRYKDDIVLGDTVLIWMAGPYAGVYAQAEVSSGVEDQSASPGEESYWANSEDATLPRPRVSLRFLRRFLGAPLLRKNLIDHAVLKNLMILRQPTGTNFRVTDAEWSELSTLLPAADSRLPDEEVVLWCRKRAQGGRLYERSCGELLERYIHENLDGDTLVTRDALLAWFAERYPLLKPVTVQCHIEKYTTNFASRAHYGARPEHDLLFRVDGDWSRLRRYRPESDPAPLYDRPSSGGAEVGSARRTKLGSATRTERHRALLRHFCEHGELDASELAGLGVDREDLTPWLDSLVAARPGVWVARPQFLLLAEKAQDPRLFAPLLASRFMGPEFERRLAEPPQLTEELVWEQFGGWHLPDTEAASQRQNGYLVVPADESPSQGAAERIRLYTHLDPETQFRLEVDPEFATAKREWAAAAAGQPPGPLSLQLERSFVRPFFPSEYVLPSDVEDDAGVSVAGLPLSSVLARRYVTTAVPLSTAKEWSEGVVLDCEEIQDRLTAAPLGSLLVQIEVYRQAALLADEPVPSIELEPSGEMTIAVGGAPRGSLARAARRLLEDCGFWITGPCASGKAFDRALSATVANLTRVGILQINGRSLSLSEEYAGRIKSRPQSIQNRGEKVFRQKLSKILTRLNIGEGGAT